MGKLKDDCIVRGNETANAFYSSSDIRLKENIIPISNTFREFTWKESGLKSYGLIAQEIEDEYPELVSNNGNGYKSINYTSALCMIIAKLENEIDKLKDKTKSDIVVDITACKELVNLKSEIEKLKARILELENKLSNYEKC